MFSSDQLHVPHLSHHLFLFLQNFAKEIVISDPKELDEDYIREELRKAGGANYDAQAM